ncbi:hypothetical protein [Helicobacter sp. 23-1045]
MFLDSAKIWIFCIRFCDLTKNAESRTKFAESNVFSSLRGSLSEAKTTKRLCEAPTHTCKSTF